MLNFFKSSNSPRLFTRSIDTHVSTFYTIFQYLKNFQDFQENDVITGGKMALFGGTSTQINCICPMNLCGKCHAFSTICKIFSLFTYTFSIGPTERQGVPLGGQTTRHGGEMGYKFIPRSTCRYLF